MTEHFDRSVSRVVEPRDQGEQRGLSCAVETEQRSEARPLHRQADVLQRLARSVGVADVPYGERRTGTRDVGHAVRHRDGDRVGAHFGDTTTPQGSRPTGIDFTTSSEATSIIEMSLESPLVVKRYFWSGVNVICQTRCPTSRYFRTL